MTIRRVVLVVASIALVTLSCGGESNADASRSPKSRVENYLLSSTYTRLVVEVDYVGGTAPREAAAKWVGEQIADVVDKPDGVEVVVDETLESRGGDHVWTIGELDRLASARNSVEVGEETVKMHVLFVDGSYDRDMQDRLTLGLAWQHRNIVLFADSLETACHGPFPDQLTEHICQYTQQSVWLHEVGHLLGLVNNGAPLTSEHHDAEHGAHCTNEDCVMYWLYAGTQVIDVLRSRMGEPHDDAFDFGPECLADLEAVGTEPTPSPSFDSTTIRPHALTSRRAQREEGYEMRWSAGAPTDGGNADLLRHQTIGNMCSPD